MSRKSWAQWGRERQERSLIKDFKSEVAEATAVSVFVIMNEWLPKGSQNDSSEIVDSKVFFSEDAAWTYLRELAAAMDIEVQQGETNFIVPPTEYIEYEEYYIGELNNG